MLDSVLLHAARDPRFRPVVAEVLTAGRDVAERAATVAGAARTDPGSLLALVHGYLRLAGRSSADDAYLAP